MADKLRKKVSGVVVTCFMMLLLGGGACESSAEFSSDRDERTEYSADGDQQAYYDHYGIEWTDAVRDDVFNKIRGRFYRP